MRKVKRSVWRKAYKKRRRKRIFGRVIYSLILIILIGAMVFISVLLRNNKTLAEVLGVEETIDIDPILEGSAQEESLSYDESEEMSEPEESVSVIPEEEPPEEKAAWDTEMLHKGYLILVSSEYGYDFEANADFIELVTLNDIESFNHVCENDGMQVGGRILSYLDQMLDDCDAAVGSEDTSIASAYRSIDYQSQLYAEISAEYGEEYAAQYVANPGYSEHHTGLSVDLGIFSDGYAQSFSESTNSEWVRANCFKYGFIRRYTEEKAGITGISNEAWHFRYVGIPHATYMYDNNLCLEEYLEVVKGYSQDAPLMISCNSGDYAVWYTAENVVRMPEYDYEVSGNNYDGYIVTENRTGTGA